MLATPRAVQTARARLTAQKETAESKKLLKAKARRTAPEETMTMRKPELAMQERLR